jgi:hypothetical protein
MSPEDITYSEAQNFVSAPEWVDQNRRLIGRHFDEDGQQGGDVDHWQGGDGYTGRQPSQGAKGRDVYMAALEEAYITEDLASDVTSHRVSGVVGKAPNWGFRLEGEEPTPEEQERQEAMEDWWEQKEVGQALVDFATALTTEAETFFRIRLTGLGEDGSVEADSPEEALDHIHLEQAGRDEATVYTDEETLQRVGIFVTELEDGDRAELTYLDEEGRTVLRIEDEPQKEGKITIELGETTDEDRDEVMGTPVDLGGRLLMHGQRGRLVLSESVRSNQFSLNTKRTWIEIVDEKAGFPELHLVDIEAPRDEEGNPAQPERGPGTIQYHVSIPSESEGTQGVEDRSPSPNVNEIGAADTSNLRDDCQEARVSIFRGAKQLHRLISGDATASAESRIQARADFVQDLRQLKGKIDQAGKWMLETVWALAEALAGEERGGAVAEFDCILDPGPLTADERHAMREDVKEGTLSLKRYLSQIGVDDPDAEIKRIREEQQDPITKGQAQTAQVIDSVAAGQFYRRQQGSAEDVERQASERGEGV